MLKTYPLDEIIAALRVAGETEIMPRFRTLAPAEISQKSGPRDLVTVADKAAEVRLEQSLGALFPDAGFIGEESVSTDPSRLDALTTSERLIILDPIDGTGNFVRGLPTFATIFALVEGGKTQIGILYEPALDQVTFAVRGFGAWAGPARGPWHPLVLPSKPPGFLDMSLLISVRGAPWARQNEAFQIARNFSYTQSLSATSIQFAQLATGQMDAQVSARVTPWDHAAGALIYNEAGGFSAMLDGQPYQPAQLGGRLISAPTRALYRGLCEAFAEIFA